MLVKCIHGYFQFFETAPGELSKFSDRFVSRLELDLEVAIDHVTFASLKDAPNYSIKNSKYLEATALKTFEGKPWEVMKENGLVYNFQTDEVVPITSITQRVQLDQASSYFLASGLILPGSLTDQGKRVTDYSAWYLFESAMFKYSEVTLV
jgi:hypothetical protein